MEASTQPTPQEVIFLSYSHQDQDWARRFMVMLNPAVRSYGLEVWSASAITSGERWDTEIQAAIDRAVAALVLVSPDYLASPYVVERELPALLARHVPILPVLLRPALWQEEPSLAGLQWPEDPSRDGPLQGARDRDKRIVTIVERLLDTVLATRPTPAVRPEFADGGGGDGSGDPQPGAPTAEAVPTVLDRPATADALGRAALAEVLAERLRRLRGENTEQPGGALSPDEAEALLVHIHAPWGAGKSSLLAFLRR